MPFYLKLLEQKLLKGTLIVSRPNGEQRQFGDGKGPSAHWRIIDESAINRVARDPEFQMGETYMDEAWELVDCSLYDLLCVLRINFNEAAPSRWIQPLLRITQQFNRIANSYRNVAHHYDLDEAFFRLFLDDEMHYSCAYYSNRHYDIHQAQQAKCDHIAKKLLLKPGMQVLDIGCGWGSLAIYLAERHGVRVTGITVSKAQLAVAQRRAQERKLDKLVDFRLSDYREHQGEYDRIVSVGMFEHVGTPFYDTYYQRVAELLREDGVAMIHTIGRTTPPGLTNAWISKYIFPGGSIPAFSEISASIEKADITMTDNEVWRIHYADTLRDWNRRFQIHRESVRADKDERFCRMWEFYLACCEMSFRYADLVVFQTQLAHKHGVVPITRDYLHPNPLLETTPRPQTQVMEPQSEKKKESIAS
ncbi:MAG: cyclopropane-fatty-acyl-phospholipid synthase family protein [Pseudomonadota bacterium]